MSSGIAKRRCEGTTSTESFKPWITAAGRKPALEVAGYKAALAKRHSEKRGDKSKEDHKHGGHPKILWNVFGESK